MGARIGKYKLEARAGKYKLGVRAEGQAKGRGMENTKTHFMTSSSFVAIKSIEYVLSVYSSTNCVEYEKKTNLIWLRHIRTVCFQGDKAWFMCTYPSDSNNVLHCKNILLAWLITLTPTLKYTRLNYYKNCVFISPSGVWVMNK